MDRITFNHSDKNIPIPHHQDFTKRTIEKTESLLRRMRWQAFFFLNPEARTASKETFGFNTTKSPTPIPELKPFEDGMLKIIQNMKTTNTTNTFQSQLAKEVDNIKHDPKLIIPADKTSNYYRMNKETYNKQLESKVTTAYRKAPANTTSKLNREGKSIATRLKLADRINTIAEKPAFITLKDHKPDFHREPTSRLINPSKPETGKISKQILDRVNNAVRTATKVNQWKSTTDVISWFKNIKHMKDHSFICFDIVDFYPSIDEDLLEKAMQFASRYVTITDEDKHIITQTKQSVLFHNQEVWRKNGTNSLFDVTMGSYDGAETCELVGSYLLAELSTTYNSGNESIGLYRDDGLAVFKQTPQIIDTIKKDIIQFFRNHNLTIKIEANMKVVNYLDVTLNLNRGTFQPFSKPNNSIRYVHHQSNHPPTILKNIPESINKRLSNISSDEQAFKATTPPYQEALHNSGYKYQLHYSPSTTTKKRTRQRKIIWYNPPYSTHIATNIGQLFLKLIDKCFTNRHPLSKIFNRNTLKLSYSCMPNMKAIIATHNKQKLESNHPPQQQQMQECNCRKKEDCPLDGKCKTNNIVYQATVQAEGKQDETYIGISENTFKTRYYNHRSSFKNNFQATSTELSKYVWKLKDSNVPHEIKWKIIQRSRPYNNATKRCNLCLTEKLIIICQPHKATLNKRNELVSTCRHRKKFLLEKFGT